MPFTEEQADFFFGREAEREIITANLMASRLTLLYGPSGVGKSSVLNAGVAHHLRAEQTRTKNGKPEFGIVTFRTWRDDPLAGLEHAIGKEIGRPVAGTTFSDRLVNGTEAVAGDLLIILDQFEEYFLYHATADGDGTFAVEFPRVVNRPDLRVSFLVSMREDSIAKLDFFKGRIPNLFDNYLRIDHLERSQARDAIVRPVEEFNRQQPAGTPPMRIDPALVDTVLNQVTRGRVAIAGTGKGRLGRGTGAQSDDARVETPYLQLVLTRLWQEETAAGSRELRASTLERLGGAGHIVATHLDAALAALTPEERDAAAGIFQYLVTPSGTKIALGVDDLAQYANRKKEAIQPLLVRLSSGENRILTPVAPPPDQPSRESYQIFHDVLATAVLEWRTRYQAAARLRKQRRLWFGLLTAAGVLLIAVLWVSFYVYRQNRLLEEAQGRFFEVDTRVTGLVDQAKAAQAAAVAGFEEAQRLYKEAGQLARAGQSKAAAELEVKANAAAAQAQTAQAEGEELYKTIATEQKQAGDLQKQAEDLSKNPPKGGGLTRPGGGAIAIPTPAPPAKDPGTPTTGAGPATGTTSGDYRQAFRMAINAKNRRQWREARDLLERAIKQNPVESTESIPISGSSYFELYLPKYQLGIALSNLGDCRGALNAFEASEKDGAVQKDTKSYRNLEKERKACGSGK
jgi:tetratricopeptide (TPR) repeat protein